MGHFDKQQQPRVHQRVRRWSSPALQPLIEKIKKDLFWAIILFLSFCFISFLSSKTHGADPEPGTPIAGAPTSPSAPMSKLGPEENSKDQSRNFYQVLEDVLADFEYDLKNGEVRGLKNLAIRNMASSENIPGSFNTHLELLITERVLKLAQQRMIQCLACRSKKATLTGSNVVVTSTENNATELARVAKVSGIDHFMDVAFAYQPTGLILSFFVTEAETNAVVWSRSYNSETSRAAAFRRGVDYTQIDEARKKEVYEPTVLYRPTVYYMFEREVSGTVGVLGVGLRVVERYDNRKKEVGFELDYMMDVGALVGEVETSTTPTLYGGMNLTMLFVHAWNLIGEFENFNQVRGNIFLGIGGTYASGFLGGLVRGGYEWRLGKHWAVSANLGYRPQATMFINGASGGSVSGLEFGLGVSALF